MRAVCSDPVSPPVTDVLIVYCYTGRLRLFGAAFRELVRSCVTDLCAFGVFIMLKLGGEKNRLNTYKQTGLSVLGRVFAEPLSGVKITLYLEMENREK